ncbi:2'-5' RNA ligase family protein [Streptomyces sp. KR80]|uniref:2'-5' RNA ligase family protein n=1 Tax=Streptomyces sp. KR80 TaxID=3457426 RepID=UPI003FD46241
MAEGGSGVFQAGQTALIVAVPEAEPVVGRWRERLDPSVRAGVPAHVTVLFPFLDESRVDSGVLAALAELMGGHEVFDVRFEVCGRFPEVLYLTPAPDRPLRDLTRAVADRWPEAPPYGGQFADILPHLTIAQYGSSEDFDAVEASLRAELPIVARVSEVHLMVCDGVTWHDREMFALRE